MLVLSFSPPSNYIGRIIQLNGLHYSSKLSSLTRNTVRTILFIYLKRLIALTADTEMRGMQVVDTMQNEETNQ